MILKKLTSFFILFLLVLSTLGSFAFADKQFDANVGAVSELVDDIDNELEMILTTIAIGKDPSFARLNTLRDNLAARIKLVSSIVPSDIDSNEELNALAEKLDRIEDQLFEIEENSEVIGLNEDLGKDADFAAGMMIRVVQESEAKLEVLDTNMRFKADVIVLDNAVEFFKTIVLAIENRVNNVKENFDNEEITEIKEGLSEIFVEVENIENVVRGLVKVASANKDSGSLEILNGAIDNINVIKESIDESHDELDLMREDNEPRLSAFDTYSEEILWVEDDVESLNEFFIYVEFELNDFMQGNFDEEDIPTLEQLEDIKLFEEDTNEDIGFMFEDIDNLIKEVESDKELTLKEKIQLLDRLEEAQSEVMELEEIADDRIFPLIGEFVSFVEDLIAGEEPVDEPVDDNGDDAGDDNADDDNQESDEESEYNELRNRYNEADDDYDRFKRRYREAVDDEDSRDIERYEDKLRDVREETEDLEEDIEDFIEELEDNNDNDQFDDLIDDLENLENDVEDLNEDVIKTLRGENRNSDSLNTIVPTVVPEQVTPEPQVVVVQDPTLANGITGASVVNTQAEGWDNFRTYGWIIGGIIILLALIVFLVAVLLKN